MSKNFSLNHPTTILIPTRNRQPQLARQIPFLATVIKDFDIDVRVLDGSTIENCAAENKKICAEYGINYRRYDPEISFFERVYLAVSEIGTYTVSILDDEDILSVNALMEAVDFLHKNKDYSVAYGKYKSVTSRKGRLRYYNTYNSKDIISDSVLERIWERISTYNGGEFHGVHVRNSFLSIFKELATSNISYDDPGSFELLFSAIAVSFGKLKTLNCFFKGRVTSTPLRGSSIDYIKLIMGKTDLEMSNPERTFIELHTRNKNILKKYINNVDEETLDTALDCIFASYFLFAPYWKKINERTFYQCLGANH